MRKRLELHKETLRTLSDESLQEVAGGAQTTLGCGSPDTQTYVCPSGATWFSNCESALLNSCG